jgi:tetratricopeptide (TPR) repeat protein
MFSHSPATIYRWFFAPYADVEPPAEWPTAGPVPEPAATDALAVFRLVERGYYVEALRRLGPEPTPEDAADLQFSALRVLALIYRSKFADAVALLMRAWPDRQRPVLPLAFAQIHCMNYDLAIALLDPLVERVDVDTVAFAGPEEAWPLPPPGPTGCARMLLCEAMQRSGYVAETQALGTWVGPMLQARLLDMSGREKDAMRLIGRIASDLSAPQHPHTPLLLDFCSGLQYSESNFQRAIHGSRASFEAFRRQFGPDHALVRALAAWFGDDPVGDEEYLRLVAEVSDPVDDKKKRKKRKRRDDEGNAAEKETEKKEKKDPLDSEEHGKDATDGSLDMELDSVPGTEYASGRVAAADSSSASAAGDLSEKLVQADDDELDDDAEIVDEDTLPPSAAYEKASKFVALSEEYFGYDSIFTIDAEVSALAILEMESRFKAAEKQGLVALERCRAGGHFSLEAYVLNNICCQLWRMEKFAESYEMLKISYGIRVKNLRPTHQSLITSTRNMALLTYKLRLHTESMHWWSQAAEMSRSAYGEVHKDVLEACDQLALQHYLEDDATGEVTFRRRHLALLRQLHGGSDNAAVVESLLNLTRAYWRADQVQVALDHCREALAVAERLAGEHGALVSNALVLCSDLLCVIRQFDEALEHSQRALDIRSKLATKKNDRMVYAAKISIARTLADLERFNESLEIYLELFRSRAPRTKPSEADARLHERIASVYYEQQNYSSSREHYENAMNIWGELRGAESQEYAGAMQGLATSYAMSEQYELALARLLTVLDLHRSLGLSNVDLARSYSNVGTVYGLMGNSREAVVYLRHGLDLSERAYGTGAHPDVIQMRVGLVHPLMDAGDRESAFAMIRRSQADLGLLFDPPISVVRLVDGVVTQYLPAHDD